MKNIILPLTVVLFLIPKHSISQNSSDSSSLLTVIANAKHDFLHTNSGTIETLSSFELVTEGYDNGLKIQASFTQKENFDVELYNSEGIIIYEESFDSDKIKLAMGFANLPSDDYYVSIATKEGRVIKPIK